VRPSDGRPRGEPARLRGLHVSDRHHWGPVQGVGTDGPSRRSPRMPPGLAPGVRGRPGCAARA